METESSGKKTSKAVLRGQAVSFQKRLWRFFVLPPPWLLPIFCSFPLLGFLLAPKTPVLTAP